MPWQPAILPLLGSKEVRDAWNSAKEWASTGVLRRLRAPSSVRAGGVTCGCWRFPRAGVRGRWRLVSGLGLWISGRTICRRRWGRCRRWGICRWVWHFVGAIQSNKTRDIASRFQWVHTVDRARIASRLDAAARRPIDVCIQVNIDAEAQKAGVAPEQAGELARPVRGLPQLRLRGLMAIPRPLRQPPHAQAPCRAS